MSVKRVLFEKRARETMAELITGFGGTLKPFFSEVKSSGSIEAIVRDVNTTDEILVFAARGDGSKKTWASREGINCP